MVAWQMAASPVSRVIFRGQCVHVKRDDVFHLAGNKMRKLYWFLQQPHAYYRGAHLVSFGGTQSNAMLAIAQVAHKKRVPFTYFSRAFELKKAQNDLGGNLQAAKALGMRHVELPVAEYQELATSKDLASVSSRHIDKYEATNLVHIPQGAAFAQAEDGVRVLAQELNEYCGASRDIHFSVVVPCGTGSTAFYLAQHLDPRLQLFGVPCVGDAKYLHEQFVALAGQHGLRHMQLPQVLVPSAKARFGRLSWPLLDVYDELLAATGIEFDLLYACFAWSTLFEPRNLSIAAEGGRQVLYVHSGGVSGNASMLARYNAKTRPS